MIHRWRVVSLVLTTMTEGRRAWRRVPSDARRRWLRDVGVGLGGAVLLLGAQILIVRSTALRAADVSVGRWAMETPLFSKEAAELLSVVGGSVFLVPSIALV